MTAIASYTSAISAGSVNMSSGLIYPPQITVAGDEGKELCPSLLELAEEVPEIKVYAKYCVLKQAEQVMEQLDFTVR